MKKHVSPPPHVNVQGLHQQVTGQDQYIKVTNSYSTQKCKYHCPIIAVCVHGTFHGLKLQRDIQLQTHIGLLTVLTHRPVQRCAEL